MAWTAPMTAVANSAWTSAQWNTHVRDNLLETMPGKATTAGDWFATAAASSIARRAVTGAAVATSQTTASTSYADLATVGPAVTVTTGTAALVTIAASVADGTVNTGAYASVAVSSGTTIAASDAWAVIVDGLTAASPLQACNTFLMTGLNAGSNVFTMKYKVDAGTGTFVNREIFVIPL